MMADEVALQLQFGTEIAVNLAANNACPASSWNSHWVKSKQDSYSRPPPTNAGYTIVSQHKPAVPTQSIVIPLQ